MAFRKILQDKGVSRDASVGETNTLTYICRLADPAEVKITARTKTQFAVLPGKETKKFFQVFQELFPGSTERDKCWRHR